MGEKAGTAVSAANDRKTGIYPTGCKDTVGLLTGF